MQLTQRIGGKSNFSNAKSSINVRGLRSWSRLEWDETRQDWTSFPELAVPGRDYFFLVSYLEKIQENPENKRDKTGLLNTAREILKQ